jgi:hypothetical protein
VPCARLLAVVAIALAAVVSTATRAESQAQLCSAQAFGTAKGATVCDGSSRPITASATVVTAAQLTLDHVFGQPATSLGVDFGLLDYICAAAPNPGVSCVENTKKGYAVWYGDLEFSVRLAGTYQPIGKSGKTSVATARLTGLRSAGIVPAGALLDGPAGVEPTTAYSTTGTIDLQTGISHGRTVVTRSFGLKVSATDAAAVWTVSALYSVVME